MLRIVCETFTSVIFLFFNAYVCTELPCKVKSVSVGHGKKKKFDNYYFKNIYVYIMILLFFSTFSGT